MPIHDDNRPEDPSAPAGPPAPEFTVYIRMPADAYRALQTLVSRMQVDTPWTKVSMSDAARRVLARGIEALRAEGELPVALHLPTEGRDDA